ncbi:MAG: hypothetical protein WBH66_09295 [Rectinemataceae bacterium]
MIEKGMKAPDFSLADEEGKLWTLGDLCGGPGTPVHSGTIMASSRSEAFAS